MAGLLSSALTAAFNPSYNPASGPAGRRRTPVVLGPATWNPSDKAADIALSGGDLTATGTMSPDANAGVRAYRPKSSGKWYFEVTLDARPSGSIRVGLAPSTLSLTVPFAFQAGSAAVSVDNSGSVYRNANLDTIVDPFTVGQTIRVAVDLDARKIWFRTGTSGDWNTVGGADPAAGTGYLGLTGVATVLYPAVYVSANGIASTAKFESPAFTPPTGFTPWGT